MTFQIFDLVSGIYAERSVVEIFPATLSVATKGSHFPQ